MAEGGGLLNRYTVKSCIQGSNPCLTANLRFARLPVRHVLGVSGPSASPRPHGPNPCLPIPFDGAGSLEIDLLCADARVAVELDGAQHLADRVAYRRDRRKDQLLQESGYLVLRFLAEDLGRDLDTVLDAILRALSHRASSGSAAPLHFVRGGRA